MDNLEIKKFIASELALDKTLSEIQQAVNEKFSTKMTFMDIRILASELDNIDWGKNDKKVEKVAEKVEEPQAVEPNLSGKTLIEVSKLVRPGMVANGSVTFLSGASAEWFIDHTGRLGLDKVTGQPTKEDAQDFQTELQKLFAE